MLSSDIKLMSYCFHNKNISLILYREKAWRISYHVYKDKKTMKSSTVRPIKWSSFNHTVTNVYGQKYHFSWSWTDWQKYIHYSYLGGLYVGTWVPPTYSHKFESLLYEYYRKYYKGLSVGVD